MCDADHLQLFKTSIMLHVGFAIVPAQVISLYKELHGTTPPPTAISAAGVSCDHGETLSEALRDVLSEIIDRTEDVVGCLAGSMQGANRRS
jgi:hypothetical protein